MSCARVALATGLFCVGGLLACATSSGSGRSTPSAESTAPSQPADTDLFAMPDSCKPAPGPKPDACSLYSENDSWLPSAYVGNATCACSKTPDSPTANCVRGYLDTRLREAPESMKQKWKSEKEKYDRFGLRFLYAGFVVDKVTPVIYGWHKEAYETCCCPSGPAVYIDWIGVTTVNLESCGLVNAMIDLFGSCHGTPGHW